MNQTAVDFIKLKLEEYGDPYMCQITWEEFDSIIEQAKEMEKQQIVDACNLQRNDYKGMPTYNKSGEQYYNETYKK